MNPKINNPDIAVGTDPESGEYGEAYVYDPASGESVFSTIDNILDYLSDPRRKGG